MRGKRSSAGTTAREAVTTSEACFGAVTEGVTAGVSSSPPCAAVLFPREKNKKTFAFPLKNGAQCSIIVVYCKGTVRTTLFRRGKTRLAGIRQSRPPRLFRLPLLFAKFYIVKFCEGCGMNWTPCRSSSLQYGGIAASSSRQSISKSTRQKCEAIKSCGFAPRQGKDRRPCRAHGQGP